MDEPPQSFPHFCPECRQERDFTLAALVTKADGNAEAVYECPACKVPPRPGMRTTTMFYDDDNTLIAATRGGIL